jgi:hypothetical protein
MRLVIGLQDAKIVFKITDGKEFVIFKKTESGI